MGKNKKRKRNQTIINNSAEEESPNKKQKLNKQQIPDSDEEENELEIEETEINNINNNSDEENPNNESNPEDEEEENGSEGENDDENDDEENEEEDDDEEDIENRLYKDDSDGEVTFNPKSKKQIFEESDEEEEENEENEENESEREEEESDESDEDDDDEGHIHTHEESKPEDTETDMKLTELAKDEDLLNAASTLDYQKLKERIQDTVQVLSDKELLKKSGKSRSEYTQQLSKDIQLYYGYNEDLIDNILIPLFNPSELFNFLEAMETERPVVIRTNTLKTRRKVLAQNLIQRGINCDPVGDWSKVGLIIYETPISIGATPEYLAGHYMLQSAASFLPVMALQPQPNERVLDMCSAPGGKTSYIAQLMKNTGTLIANDLKLERLKATTANLSRLGVQNCIIVNQNGTDFPKLLSGFDRVLLDAPCSGLGVISRDSTIKATRTTKDVIKNSVIQKKLILSAIDSVDCNSKTGGIIVYSTCSISVQENEMVVNYALRKRFVKLIDTELPFGNNGLTKYQSHHFHKSLDLTRRFYPHTHNTDGFFVAKFRKYANGVREEKKNKDDDKEKEENEEKTEKIDESKITDSLFADNAKSVKKNKNKMRKREKMLKKQSKNNELNKDKHKKGKKPKKVNK